MLDRTADRAYSRRSPAGPSVPPGHAWVAQLVEHATENRSVGGSIPSPGTIFYNLEE